MEVLIQKSAARLFRRKANKAAPREEFGILLGEISGGIIVVQDIYFPPNRMDESTEESTSVCLDWFKDAEDWSERLGKPWIAVGDIHSHCYKETQENLPQHEPSEQDWESSRAIYESVLPSYCVFGICRVIIGKKRKRATIKLWPLIPELNTTIIEGKDEEE